MAAIRELPQSTSLHSRELRQLVDCGSATKGDDVPQFERFYTVPKNWANKREKKEKNFLQSIA